MKRKIKWYYWRSPLEADPDREWGPEDEWTDAEVMTEEEDAGNVRAVVPTPVGYVPTQVYTSMNRAFNMWVGSLNFDLTPEVMQKIEDHPGVETLDVLTRYRFRIGIGLSFETRGVLRGIEEVLGASSAGYDVENPLKLDLTPEMQSRVDAIKAATNNGAAYWACLVLPNGYVDSIRDKDEDVVFARLDAYRQTQSAVGGVIYRCESSQ